MVGIYHELTGKKRLLISFDLRPEEFAAIGKVTVQWALLEHLIYGHTAVIATQANVPIPKDANNLSFTRRLTVWRLTVEEFVPEGDRERLLKIVSKVANLQQFRHEVTHGLWDWDDDNPDRLTATSLRPQLEFEKNLDVARIEALAEDIAEVSCAIRYPDGWTDFFQDYVDENGHIAFAARSRPQPPGSKETIVRIPPAQDSATPPEDTPPQSSSKE